MTKKMKTAIVPGSFDPMTIGHLAIITKASEIFDNVVVAIMNNPSKKGFFTLAEKKLMAEKTCSGLSNVKVVTADGLLVDLARALGARYIVKGIRNAVDFEYEQNMSKINHEFAPEIQTIFLPSLPEVDIISSSLVRELLNHDKPVDKYIHPDALYIVSNKK